MIALAEALRARSHDVSFVTPSNFVESIAELGFRATGDGIDIARMMQTHGGDLSSLRWQARYVADIMIPRLFEATARVSEGVDLIVGAGVQLAAASVAEWRRIPYVNVTFCPCAIPSGAWPPPLIRTQSLPEPVNRALWALVLRLAGRSIAPPIAAGRSRLGLPRIDHPFKQLTNVPTLVAADRDLAPLDPEAPANVTGTDAWIAREPTELHPRLPAFLAMNPAPIYAGFGSMVSRDPEALRRSVIEAARALGRPLILAGGWASLDRHPADADDVLAVPSVPHTAVFPRVAAVVHHGGAGTTTAAARAGVPQVVIPHILDQFYWAYRVERLGLGPRGLPVELVNADVLTDRLITALTNSAIAECVATLAPAVAERDGIPAAVTYLEGLT